jgi:hypothetical protein
MCVILVRIFTRLDVCARPTEVSIKIVRVGVSVNIVVIPVIPILVFAKVAFAVMSRTPEKTSVCLVYVRLLGRDERKPIVHVNAVQPTDFASISVKAPLTHRGTNHTLAFECMIGTWSDLFSELVIYLSSPTVYIHEPKRFGHTLVPYPSHFGPMGFVVVENGVIYPRGIVMLPYAICMASITCHGVAYITPSVQKCEIISRKTWAVCAPNINRRLSESC